MYCRYNTIDHTILLHTVVRFVHVHIVFKFAQFTMSQTTLIVIFLIWLLIVKLAIILLGMENAEGLRRGHMTMLLWFGQLCGKMVISLTMFVTWSLHFTSQRHCSWTLFLFLNVLTLQLCCQKRKITFKKQRGAFTLYKRAPRKSAR